ncbi:MAG: efflux transporter periplasmic adaptor subunit, partial [Candidatus Omnitrophica bacterium]|nr:efflux transporter periplasmic adaptor subunit [Candidatus Omnitrophota bacterium]
FVVIDEKVHKRPVTLGIREDSLFEVKEGLSAGEKVVVQGQYGVEDGIQVKSEESQ